MSKNNKYSGTNFSDAIEGMDSLKIDSLEEDAPEGKQVLGILGKREVKLPRKKLVFIHKTIQTHDRYSTLLQEFTKIISQIPKFYYLKIKLENLCIEGQHTISSLRFLLCVPVKNLNTLDYKSTKYVEKGKIIFYKDLCTYDSLKVGRVLKIKSTEIPRATMELQKVINSFSELK